MTPTERGLVVDGCPPPHTPAAAAPPTTAVTNAGHPATRGPLQPLPRNNSLGQPQAGRTYKVEKVWPPDRLQAHAQRTLGKGFAFGRLPSALEQAKAQPDSRVWAIDVPARLAFGGGAPKQYWAASAADLLKAYCAPGIDPAACHLYEVLSVDRPCWAFLDLEHKLTPDEHMLAARAAADRATAATMAAVSSLASGELASDLRVRVLDSSRPGKFSRHVLLHTAVVAADGQETAAPPLAGLLAARTVAKEAEARLREANDHAAASFLDLGVYHDRRAFRLVGSAKLADVHKTPLVLDRLASTEDRLDPAHGGDHGGAHGGDHGAGLGRFLVHPPGAPPRILLATAKGVTEKEPAAVAQAATSATPQPRFRNWERFLAVAGDECPLLDHFNVTKAWHAACPYKGHPYLVASRGGTGSPPMPFERLGRWASAQLRKLGCDPVASTRMIRHWQYEHASRPDQRMLHLIGAGGVCHHVGRKCVRPGDAHAAARRTSAVPPTCGARLAAAPATQAPGNPIDPSLDRPRDGRHLPALRRSRLSDQKSQRRLDVRQAPPAGSCARSCHAARGGAARVRGARHAPAGGAGGGGRAGGQPGGDRPLGHAHGRGALRVAVPLRAPGRPAAQALVASVVSPEEEHGQHRWILGNVPCQLCSSRFMGSQACGGRCASDSGEEACGEEACGHRTVAKKWWAPSLVCLARGPQTGRETLRIAVFAW